jgi:nucleoside-diphosphate-sugar epimerase
MRVTVLGGTEFIGRRIVEQLCGRGDDVQVVHRGRTEPAPLLGEHVHADRAQFAAVAQRVRAFGPDAVVDTIALSEADATAVLPHLPDVPLVLLSSQDVYRSFELLRASGETIPVPYDEEAPLRVGRFPHADVEPDYEKLHVEPHYLTRGGTALRLGMVYGPRDPQRREEPFLRRVRAGRRRIPIGAATTLFSMVHVDDAASAVLATLDRPTVSTGQVFNIAERVSLTVDAWARVILAAAGGDAVPVRVPDSALPADLRLTRRIDQHLLADSTKAVRLLDWHPEPTTTGTPRSVEWHLAHPPVDADPDFSADDAALALADGAANLGE